MEPAHKEHKKKPTSGHSVSLQSNGSSGEVSSTANLNHTRGEPIQFRTIAMSSFFPSFQRSTTVEDAPIDQLPAVESAALESLEARLKPVFISGIGLHEADPWRSLSEKERRLLLLRFLRYQLLNVDKATTQVLRVAEWRKSENPWARDLSCLRGAVVGLPLASPATRGRGNEIVLFLPACQYDKTVVDHSRQEIGIKTFFEYCAYQKDGLRASAGLFLVDFRDLTMKNVDLVTARYAIRILMDYYPEVFCKILFINYPKWIYGNARTVAKVVWIADGAQLDSELGKFFNTQELPTWLGGSKKVNEINLFSGKKLNAEEIKEGLFNK